MKALSRSKRLSIRNTNESYALSTLKEIIMIDSDTHLEHAPVEFDTVKSKKDPWIASSSDWLEFLQADDMSKEEDIGIKLMAAASAKINTSRKYDKLNILLRYVFGDNNFKDAICSKCYMMQVIYYALVMEASKVLLAATDKIKLSQLLLSVAINYHLSVCKSILRDLKEFLNFYHHSSTTFPKDQSTNEQLTKKFCHDDAVAINIYLGIWKWSRTLIEKNGKLLPPKNMTAPANITF